MAVKKISTVAEADGYAEREYYYTAYAEVNQLLNRYAWQAKKEGIWFSVDGTGFCKNVMGSEFCIFLELLLEQATDTCVRATPPGKRYVKIRSMNAQNKVFIKIRYSCEDMEVTGFDKRIYRVREMLKSTNGYFSAKMTEEECLIRAAIALTE